MIEFFVHGQAVPQGSKRVIKGNLVEVGDKRLKDWRQAVASTCYQAMNGHARFLDGPVLVTANFHIPRPKNHYRTGRNSHLLRDGLPSAPCSRPDLDKLTRALLDALTGVAFRDDGQVAGLSVAKIWCGESPPGVYITIKSY